MGKGTEDAEPLTGVFYICENCDTPIAENQKPKMLRASQWKSTVEAKDKRYAGFHLNRLYSPWVIPIHEINTIHETITTLPLWIHP